MIFNCKVILKCAKCTRVLSVFGPCRRRLDVPSPTPRSRWGFRDETGSGFSALLVENSICLVVYERPPKPSYTLYLLSFSNPLLGFNNSLDNTRFLRHSTLIQLKIVTNEFSWRWWRRRDIIHITYRVPIFLETMLNKHQYEVLYLRFSHFRQALNNWDGIRA